MNSESAACSEAPQPDRSRRRRMWAVGLALVVIVVLAARPIIHLLRTASQDVDDRSAVPAGQVDDVSRMNATDVHAIVDIPVELERAEQQLRELLESAREQGLKVSIAGARHSMGGHTFYPGGLTVNTLPLNGMELDAETGILRVQSGALWSDIIPWLDKRGRSVAVMQSNNSFSVGGSISVNCHGWQYGRPPIASTVVSFRLMKADGTIVRCSRDENTELFSLVLGGYGLFGVILDVELRTVPNVRYRLETFVVPADDSLATYDREASAHSDVAMVYARMNVSKEKFLDEVMLYVLIDEPAPDGSLPELEEAGFVSLRRHIFRGSVDSDYGKRLRWKAETKLKPKLTGSIYSRNQLLNEGVEVFQNRSADTTDILHEYFVPRESVAAFVQELREIIPRRQGNLLNVTVRQVETDTDTFLRYADREMLALVMLFNQPLTKAGDEQMRAMTRDMIDAALRNGGRYYLPYRLHATVEQFHRAYPQAREFFKLKRKYDPDGLFQNTFYARYGETSDVGAQTD